MNNDVRTIVLAGVGGRGDSRQPRLTTALIDAGYDVKMSEIHGMAQRGGSVSTTVPLRQESRSLPLSEKAPPTFSSPLNRWSSPKHAHS